MVLLSRAVLCSSHRLSIQTTALSGTVWPQFAKQVLTRGCEPPFWGKVVVDSWGLKMGSLSSPVVTSYPLSIGLSLTVFAVLRLVTDRRTEGRTDGIGLAKGGNFIGRQTLELCTEIYHWFIQQSIATVRVVKNGQRSDFVGQNFVFFF